jgi:predicted nucleotidyltransferase
VGKDPITNEYLLVIRNVYDPRNLLTVLFERLTTIEEEDPEKDKENALSLIETYLGTIEKREKVSLEELKKKLSELTRSMKDTLATFQEDEFSVQILKNYRSPDRAYFEPISELLEGS